MYLSFLFVLLSNIWQHCIGDWAGLEHFMQMLDNVNINDPDCYVMLGFALFKVVFEMHEAFGMSFHVLLLFNDAKVNTVSILWHL